MYQSLIQIGLPVSLILIMTGVGLSLTLDDFKRVLQQPRGFIVGALCQMLLLPLFAILIIAVTGLTGELAIGLFILALCPGGTTSNLYSYLAKADVGLSVSLTTIVGFITPFTIPLLGTWAISYYASGDTTFELPIITTWIKLMAITVVPVFAGMWIRKKWTTFAHSVEPYVGKFSATVLFLVVLSIVIELEDKVFTYIVQAGPAALTLNILTMILGYAAGKLLVKNELQARTICLEVGLQNGTLALLITTTILQSAPMSISPSVYSLLMFFTASLFTAVVLKKQPVVESTTPA
ncbi:bile acid:sodium symporter family protein [Endozoicomonas arenosclerae]|uniref:bile acid:sodium symporter family protein n=1 Tax=Endozoicomonas arenosclerae TaxID=1633495 RepID=UPI00078577E3|nr:bile acid:sodium symporter family protein [Endozoicomonas arenosclerae]